MKFQLAKKGIYFIPATDQDKEKAVKVGQGEIVNVEFKTNRNTLFHRKFFALLNIGFENQDELTNFEHYRAKVLIAIGYCDFIFTETGQINYLPKSISYSSLPDNNEFERLVYTPALTYIAEKLYMSNSELADEVNANF
jgi:hypothetical protein